ncbi:MAG: DNA polymerase III subunit delta [Lachnospiraceae bacterium]|nr:DNA polymerase III subunit delta [Lachnospiraceae bacterium]
MENLNKDIKEGQFKNLYLLTGEEDYLLLQYKRRLTRAMVSPDDTMNYSYFEGKDIDLRHLLELADTMPFLSPRRVIVVENSGFFKASTEELAEYLQHIPETTHFIFVEKEINKTFKAYKAAAKAGYVANLERMNAATLKKWILSRIVSEGYKITGGAMELFMQYCGVDMNRIETELEKLLSYTMEKKEIREEDVESITSRNLEDHIFVMTDAVARQDRDKALKEYYDLLALKVDSGFILGQLIRQINLMYQARCLREKGYGRKEMASRIGLSEWVTGKYVENASRYTKERLRALLETGVDFMERQRTSRLGEKLTVEMFLIEASSRKR